MKSLRVLLIKDFRCFWRAKESVLALFGFSLMLVVVASFAFRQIGYGQEDLKNVTPGILWTTFLFTGIITLNQSFHSEKENCALTGLLLSSADPMVIYFSKLISNFFILALIQLFITVLHGIFFGVEIFPFFLPLITIIVLTALYFASLGTLLASIAIATTGREIILPLLLFPLSLPGIAGAVQLTRELLKTEVLVYTNFWFMLLLTTTIISVTLGMVLFEYTVRD